MPLWIEIKGMAEKEVDKAKLLLELIESAKSQEDKLTAVRLVINQDSHKVADATKNLVKKK